MIDMSGVQHHPVMEELVEVLCNKTQNMDKGFFRAEVAYFLGKVAASMRATVVTRDRGEIPVNIYACILATSGYGKGHSINIMELEVLQAFKKRYVLDTFPVISEQSHYDIANERAARKGTDPTEELEAVKKEDSRCGKYAFQFDSGTSAAIKQMRHKLLLGNAGSINLQIDEIGSNLINSTEILNLYLELYDQGLTKQKLIKNTSENERNEEIEGKTPTNMLLFGNPESLFDGGVVEGQFDEFLQTGYARRCIFAYGRQDRTVFHDQDPAEIYDRLASPQHEGTLVKWQNHFHDLADPAMFNWKMVVERAVGIEFMAYKKHCEILAANLPEHEMVRKAELSHRFFKAMKLAGAYAFIDRSIEVEMVHFQQAVKLIEESGEAFQKIKSREKPYERLAKYIATCGEEQTETDLNLALPFFKGSAGHRRDLMNLAIAYGYKNNIIIKKSFGPNNIEMYKGETLKKTNLDEMIFSYSDHFAYNYTGSEEPVGFEQLEVLTQQENLHWANHRFDKGHRAEENVEPGFNMLVLDVDGGVKLSLVQDLLREIKFCTYTTKRHTPENNRFRLIIPVNYVLEMSKEEYAELVASVVAWLPFEPSADVDPSSKQRSKKWETFADGDFYRNTEGELLDILPFIPKTSKNEDFRKAQKDISSMDSLERWFVQRIETGNRNNMMLKFALALVDSGMDFATVDKQVHAFNKKLREPMDPDRIDRTILTTVAKRYSTQSA